MRIFAACLFLFAVHSIHAANFSVTNAADSGPGSLRQALIDANASGDVPHNIRFTEAYPQSGSITLLSNLPAISALEVRIRGGDRGPVIDGVSLYSIFRAGLNVSLTIEDLNMQSGLSQNGGCIRIVNWPRTGNLRVVRSSFFRCKAVTNTNAGGGAIQWWATPPATVIIEDSTFIENQAISSEIANELPRGGAIHTTVDTYIHRSTFKNNSTNSAGDRGGYGGAVSLYQSDPGGVSIISDSRFESNVTDTATTSLGWGGAVDAFQISGGKIFIWRNFFINNQAREGGALTVRAELLSTTMVAELINNTFVENTATVGGGAIKVFDTELIADHNSFYQNSAPPDTGSHLNFNSVKMRTLINNVLAATAANTACSVTNSSIVSASIAGNLFTETCGALSSIGGSLSTKLDVQEVEISERVGVVVFMAGADPIDGGAADPYPCAEIDARGTTRPLDGDDDGTAICDVGAFEAPGDALFKNGFEG